MKKTITLLSLAFTALTANATVKTVSNNANSPGQFTDLQAAATAATANDTLYVSGSPNSYGNVSIIKPLTIIGAGALPSKDYYFATVIGNITITYGSLYTTTGSGSTIIGCDANNITLGAGDNTSAHPGISNVIITRNKINNNIIFNQTGSAGQSSIAHSGISIYNNMIVTITGNFIKNSTIRNNIINGITAMGNVNAGSTFVTNNFILSYFESCSNVTLTNNIFYSTATTPAPTSNTFCTLSNNCFYSPAHNYVLSEIIFSSNTGSNNILNQDPMFVYYDALGVLPYSYTQLSPVAGPFVDFNLSSGSPCLLTGSDALDMGIYGGLSAFIEGYPANSRYRCFPMPAIPQMLQMSIQNAAVLPSGTLNVNFKARKQN